MITLTQYHYRQERAELKTRHDAAISSYDLFLIALQVLNKLHTQCYTGQNRLLIWKINVIRQPFFSLAQTTIHSFGVSMIFLYIYNYLICNKLFIFQINAVLLNFLISKSIFLFILEKKKKYCCFHKHIQQHNCFQTDNNQKCFLSSKSAY